MGAKLSLLDITTDIYMIYQFLTSEEEGQATFGYINLLMVGASLLIQLIIVYGQNHEKGMKKVAYEILTVLLFIKPAVDAFRVASGAEMEKGSVGDPMTELVVIKANEMVRDQGKWLWEVSKRVPCLTPSQPLPSPLLHIKGRREHPCCNSPILCLPDL